MRERARLRELVVATAVGVAVVAGCVSEAPAPSAAIGPHLRTAEVATCSGIGLVDAVLHGSATDDRIAWVTRGTADRLETVWPVDFTATFRPDLEILDASGAVIAREGDTVAGACATLPGGAIFLTAAEIASPAMSAPPVEPALATSPPESNGGGDARAEGVLGGELRDGAACFWLDWPKGIPGSALVWPYGFSATADPLALLGPDGKVIARPGDTLVLGGGGPPVDYIIPPDRDPCGIGIIFVVGEVSSVNGERP